jgi:hypothetical protein
MKAWTDLKTDLAISLMSTSQSEYYIGNGVKIERFNDGGFEINNIMLNSERYQPVSFCEWNKFRDEGWILGQLNVQINTYKAKLIGCIKRINELKNRPEEQAVSVGKKEKYELKLEELYERLNKLK